MADIVERLRQDATCTSHHDAADEIERLRADWSEAIHRGNYWCEQAYKLRNERDRLREALRQIGLPGKQIVYCRDGHEEAVLHARAALKETGHE